MKFFAAVLLALCCSCTSQQEKVTAGPTHLFKKHPVNVFYFLSADCPLSQAYTPSIGGILEKYCAYNISFQAILPSPEMTLEALDSFREEYGVEIPCFIDSTLAITTYFGATITPEVFVCDSTGQILYSGRIDNWAYDTGRKRTNITEHDLENALADIVAGKPVRVSRTEAIGCFIEKE